MDDAELAFSLWGNPEVMRFIGGPYSREKVIARVQSEIENLATKHVQYWPLFHGDTFIGASGLRPRDDIFTLGFHLLPEHWGRGYAPEAARAVISYARSVLKATALYAGHHPQNDRSRRVLESLGFEYWRDELFVPTGLMHRGYLLELT